ncbi:GNAT family protein [Desulfosporosinus sp. PR]|uniref:GNAT family N-acetyltransferase n=1 Tax=Candidatus Desulfosporosinus nitrosoreducens TaxID=3401928 RepID=UPI0027F25467|nr:GNAT family protein [Desulfosporosinus sp. PR]MDQ7094033.1 GNAT family protein [Desulfosporosinus sp. PR]
MKQENVYEVCPVYQTEVVTLKQTTLEDASELLQCYSDEKAVLFFNADNCLDDFHYTTLEQMKKEIKFWCDSYQRREFVRWTVILNDTSEKVGTIEMFNRGTVAGIDSCGVLRIDLRSDCENKRIIQDLLEIANRRFYEDFAVKSILTKAIPEARERVCTLRQMGYTPLSFKKAHYYARRENWETVAISPKY